MVGDRVYLTGTKTFRQYNIPFQPQRKDNKLKNRL